MDGVRAPGERNRSRRSHTYDWRYPPGSAENSACIEAKYVVTTLDAALDFHYRTEAHIVPYVLYDPDGNALSYQPRINKSSIPWLYSQGYQIKFTCLFGDWDNPEHQPWNDALMDESEEKWLSNPWLVGYGRYYGRRGQRIFRALAEPIPLLGADAVLASWHESAHAAGIPLDTACCSALWHYMSSNVTRLDGRVQNANASYCDMTPMDVTEWVRIPKFDARMLEKFGDYGRMLLQKELERFPKQDAAIVSSASDTVRAARRRRVDIPLETREIPPDWQARITEIAARCREVPLGQRHVFYRHLAGGLCHLDAPLESLAQIVGQIAEQAGHQGGHHEQTAQDTVRRYADGLGVTGFRTIQNKFPQVGALLAEIGLAPRIRQVVEQQQAAAAAQTSTSSTLKTVQSDMALEGMFGPTGITIIQSGCGTGKTYVFEQVAAERAMQATLTETGRVPATGRTILSSDTHALASQTKENLEKRFHLPVYEFFGPASARDEQGNPLCHYHESAKILASSRIPVGQALCTTNGFNQCDYFANCKARLGAKGDPDSAVVLTVHGKLNTAVRYHGKQALLVIDEPPSMLENEVLSTDDFDHAIKQLGAFEQRYALALAPILHTLRAWADHSSGAIVRFNLLEVCERYGALVPTEVLRLACAATGYGLTDDTAVDLMECAARAIPESVVSGTLPIQVYELRKARSNPKRARVLGEAYRVLTAVHQAALGMSAERKPLLQSEPTHTGHAIRIVFPNHTYRTILQSQDRTILLDANGNLQRAAIHAFTGQEPAFHRHDVPDGAPVERCILPYAAATRTHWLPYGAPIWTNGLSLALRRTLEHAEKAGSTQQVGLISFRPVIVALGAALYPEDPAWRAVWADMGLHPSLLDLAIEQNGPLLAPWKGRLTLGYYGALKGLNTMRHCDLIATLGDPRPSVNAVELDAAYLGLSTDQYILSRAQADLEQAHGRLRAPQRTEPARMLHVGRVVPTGFGWDTAATLALQPGEGEPADAMSLDEFVQIVTSLRLTYEQLGTYLGLHPKTLAAYRRGRAIPSGIATALRTQATGTFYHGN